MARRKAVSSGSIQMAVKEITGNSDAKTYWILWNYVPELLPEKFKTFADLKAHYAAFDNITEETVQKYILQDEVQAGIKYVLKRMDAKRDIELYNKYYDLSMSGDVQALKAYMDFKKSFFSDNESDELKDILSGAKVNVADDDDDLTMEF